jgi:hypothetical protein
MAWESEDKGQGEAQGDATPMREIQQRPKKYSGNLPRSFNVSWKDTMMLHETTGECGGGLLMQVVHCLSAFSNGLSAFWKKS